VLCAERREELSVRRLCFMLREGSFVCLEMGKIKPWAILCCVQREGEIERWAFQCCAERWEKSSGGR